MTIYHFVITMAFGPAQFSTDGTYNAEPGMTRETAYTEIVALARRSAAASGVPDGHRGATLFFSLERNDIGGGDA